MRISRTILTYLIARHVYAKFYWSVKIYDFAHRMMETMLCKSSCHNTKFIWIHFRSVFVSVTQKSYMAVFYVYLALIFR